MFRHLPSLLLVLLLTAAPVLAQSSGRVSWIYDGDTLLVEGIGKVRLVGIDTPEYKQTQRDQFYRQRFGISSKRLRRIARQATRFTIRQAKGKQLRLETAQPPYDRHGRLLAYAYLPDGRLLNALLLKEGLATVFRRYDFRRKTEFLELESQARKKRKGLWQD